MCHLSISWKQAAAVALACGKVARLFHVVNGFYDGLKTSLNVYNEQCDNWLPNRNHRYR